MFVRPLDLFFLVLNCFYVEKNFQKKESKRRSGGAHLVYPPFYFGSRRARGVSFEMDEFEALVAIVFGLGVVVGVCLGRCCVSRTFVSGTEFQPCSVPVETLTFHRGGRPHDKQPFTYGHRNGHTRRLERHS